LLHEYLTLNRDESEASSDNDECKTDVDNNESTNFDDHEEFETNASDFEDVMRHATTSGEIVTEEHR
jgi:hypothetical protein